MKNTQVILQVLQENLQERTSHFEFMLESLPNSKVARVYADGVLDGYKWALDDLMELIQKEGSTL